MISDSYVTLQYPFPEAHLTIQRSRFIAYGYTVSTIEEIENILTELRKKYYDATHLCSAYRLGVDGAIYRADDNGEPSGTAGRPILGKIRSANLSDILVVVIRYFGGVKLGTSGLIKAYGEVTELLLHSAFRKEIILQEELLVSYQPQLTGMIMNIVTKRIPSEILEMDYKEGLSTLKVRVRKRDSNKLDSELSKIFGVITKKILPLHS